MSRIYYRGHIYLVVDETDEHYICIREENVNGYYIMRKETAGEVCG